jgi:hypothetical protein
MLHNKHTKKEKASIEYRVEKNKIAAKGHGIKNTNAA